MLKLAGKRVVQRIAVAAAVAVLVLGVEGTSKASGLEGADDAAGQPAGSLTGPTYRLHLFHTHTGESIDVAYKIGDTYLPAGVAMLNHFLRDHRTQDTANYDPKEFDVLHDVMARLGRPEGIIDIICGYRTPWSNNFLRGKSRNTGVAENSQHVLSKAIDIRVPGVATAKLRDVALSLGEGGVGYYPSSKFVHVDVGPVREWSFGGAPRRRHSRYVASQGE